MTERSSDVQQIDSTRDEGSRSSHDLLDLLLANYPGDTGCIVFVDGGGLRVWFVGVAVDLDNEATLREHLTKWRPRAMFLAARVGKKRSSDSVEAVAPDPSL